jgi:integrase
MQKKPLRKDYQYSGVLAENIAGYVAEKRALGCIFNTESKMLARFSRMTVDFDISKNTLPEEVVMAWLVRQPNDADKTLYHRMTVIRGFANYMLRTGHKAYVPLLGDIPRMHWHTYVPYIYTHDEILRFFAVADCLEKPKYSNSHRRHIVMPIIFRLLYCCGLRVNEALGLTIKDIDFKNELIIIRDSKFEKSRYVPMSKEMTMNLKTYVDNNIHEPWLFPARDEGKYHDKTVYEQFREILFAAGIPHGGRGKGPRIHDFRHTFAVHCLQNWIREGLPLISALPRLSTYLGHNDIVATEQYLRMTAEVYPELSVHLSRQFGYVIPKRGESNENN